MPTSFSSAVFIFVAFFNLAHADLWVGNVRIQSRHRGTVSESRFAGQTLLNNLADYNEYTVTFEVHKTGVTDVPGVEVARKLEVGATLVKDSNGEVVRKSTPSYSGQNAGNAVYTLPLSQLDPATPSNPDPEMRGGGVLFAHAQIWIDNELKLSIPLGFRYTP